MKKPEIPWWMKLNLTIEEAAEYAGIGESTLRVGLILECAILCYVSGRKKLIKRKAFEQYLEDISVI